MPLPPIAAPPRLNARVFPEASPLRAFFRWNEARSAHDRRYTIACDIDRLLRRFGREICVAHLAKSSVIRWRYGRHISVSAARVRAARRFGVGSGDAAAATAAERLVDALQAAIGAADPSAHAAVFQAFEELARHVDLAALAGIFPRHRRAAPAPSRAEILVIKLGALGDLVQALGPVPDIRRHHAGGRVTLLTTEPFAALARQSGLFDQVLVDRRPRGLDLEGWLALRRLLWRKFDRVYDFQTTGRTGLYAWLLRPGRMPEWSGTARRCSHPHANLERDRLHTMDRQAEQLLMAGIYPAATVPRLPPAGMLPAALAGRHFAMLIPGSSPAHPAKRWPAAHYGELARRLFGLGYLPVVVGVHGEEAAGRVIREVCAEALDLIGQTDIATLAALAQAARLTIGNDTGAAHVAAAGGNPVVVLFSRASSPELCAPRGRIVQVLRTPDLADLSVDTVFAAAVAAVRRAQPAASG